MTQGVTQGKIAPPSQTDQLEYMADLLAELGEIARSQKLTTLAGLLDLAHAEARLRAKEAA
ncbi:MAG TPA: hypothetical protein VEA77_07445 [Hyphomicrobium sp.]|nr:hypothetical protein [Hyphomicrobium sp.]